MADYEMTIKGLPELRKSFKQIEKGVKNTHNSLDDAGEHLVKYYSGNVFASRGGAIGESWPSLSSTYASQKARAWPGRPPLVRSGRMQRSFAYDINPARLRIKNTVDHFKYHQSGKARKKIPRRQMMKLTTTLRRDVRQIINKQLTRELRKV